nr:unnamed protein product [Leishmania braziliensis]
MVRGCICGGSCGGGTGCAGPTPPPFCVRTPLHCRLCPTLPLAPPTIEGSRCMLCNVCTSVLLHLLPHQPRTLPLCVSLFHDRAAPTSRGGRRVFFFLCPICETSDENDALLPPSAGLRGGMSLTWQRRPFFPPQRAAAMDPAMQEESPMHLDLLQGAPPSASAEQKAEAADGGPTCESASQRATIPLKRAVTSTTWAAVCPSLAMLGSVGDMESTVGGSLLPPHLLVHPQGFRILKNASVLERNMRSYFRLPQPPNAATREERRRLRRILERIEGEEVQRKARVTGNQEGVVLDGFLVLSACEAEEPDEVTQVTLQSSQLSSSVAEDLQYFTHLTSLNLSDNRLRLGHVLPFPGLKDVHLMCNGIASLEEVPQLSSSSLATITALNLAYNRIPANHLSYLKMFDALQQLDLSHNGLRALPRDLSGLAHLTHFALESNELSSSDVFYALSTMPALVEVNLARNRLSSIPPLSAGSCDGNSALRCAPFPFLQVMNLTGNRFQRVEALRPLAALHRTLRRLAVGENLLLNRQPYQKAEVQRVLDEAVVDAYYAALLPPQTDSIDPGVPPEMMNTWHCQTWTRYIPQPQGEADISEMDVVEAALIDPSSLRDTTASAPAAVASNILEEADSGGLVSENTHHQDGVSPPLPTAAEYLRRYRIHVQTPRATPPPLPKQPTRYFYSSTFRLSEQRTHGVMPHVTLPPYSEFMDVYRVLGRRRPAAQGRGGGVARSAAVRRAEAQRVSPSQPMCLPMLPHVPIPPRTEATVSSQQVGDEEGDEEPESAQRGRGFFLTGLDDAAMRSLRDATRDRKATAAPPPVETQLELTNKLASVAAGTADEPLPRTRLPRSVVSPAATNVHAAISELRVMLRKPLPSLPYDSSRAKLTTR